MKMIDPKSKNVAPLEQSPISRRSGNGGFLTNRIDFFILNLEACFCHEGKTSNFYANSKRKKMAGESYIFFPRDRLNDTIKSFSSLFPKGVDRLNWEGIDGLATNFSWADEGLTTTSSPTFHLRR